MTRLPFLLLVSMTALAAPACGSNSSSPEPIVLSDYDTSCAFDTDCVSIAVGDVCGCIGCGGGGAINVKDQSRYQADYQQRRAACPPSNVACPGLLCSCTSVACVAHTCAVQACTSSIGDAGAD